MARGRLQTPRRDALALIALLAVELGVFGLFVFLSKSISSHYQWAGEWFVTNYASLPQNEIFGRSAPVTMGVLTPIFSCGVLGLLQIMLIATVFWPRRTRRALTETDE